MLSSVLGQVSSDKLQRVDAVTADRNVDINKCALRSVDDGETFLSRWIKRQANVEAGDCQPQGEAPFSSSPFTGVDTLAARQPG